jgi:hypothetical protein
MDAIEPLYADAAATLVTLDAGYLGQHLSQRCEGLGIGRDEHDGAKAST